MIHQLMLEGNKLCANFLGWEEGFLIEIDRYGYHQTIEGFKTPFEREEIISDDEWNVIPLHELKFNSDSNWQMLVIKKIMKEKELTLVEVFMYLEQLFVIENTKKGYLVHKLNTEEDVFESLIIYISNTLK